MKTKLNYQEKRRMSTDSTHGFLRWNYTVRVKLFVRNSLSNALWSISKAFVYSFLNNLPKSKNIEFEVKYPAEFILPTDGQLLLSCSPGIQVDQVLEFMRVLRVFPGGSLDGFYFFQFSKAVGVWTELQEYFGLTLCADFRAK